MRRPAALAAVALALVVPAVAAGQDVVVADRGAFGPGDSGGLIAIAPDGSASPLAAGPPFVDPSDVARLPDGSLVVADERALGGGALLRVLRETGAVTPLATGALLAGAGTVAVSGGAAFVGTGGEGRDEGAVVRVDPATGAAGVLASGPPLRSPEGIAVGPAGDLLVADDLAYGFGALLRVDPVTGDVTTVASGLLLGRPRAVVVEAGGAIVVVCDGLLGSARIVRVDPATGRASLLAAGYPLVNPRGLAVDADGSILAGDRSAFGGHGGVVRVDPVSGAMTRVSSGEPFRDPAGLAALAAGAGDGLPKGAPVGPGGPGGPGGSAAPGGGAGAPGAGGAGGAGPGAAAQGDPVAPVLTRPTLSRSVFRAARRGRAIAAAVVPIGTRVRYALSEPARVRFTVMRARLSVRRCVHASYLARHRRCIRYRLSGTFTHRGAAGENTFRFRGRVNGRTLRPGRYRLVARAIDPSGNASLSRRVAFRIVR
jgi:hypothetical protein